MLRCVAYVRNVQDMQVNVGRRGCHAVISWRSRPKRTRVGNSCGKYTGKYRWMNQFNFISRCDIMRHGGNLDIFLVI